MIIHLSTTDYPLLREKLIHIAKHTYKFQQHEPQFYSKLHGFVRKVAPESLESTGNATQESSIVSVRFGGNLQGLNITRVVIVLDHEEERDWMKKWLLYWVKARPNWLELANETHPSFLEDDWTPFKSRRKGGAHEDTTKDLTQMGRDLLQDTTLRGDDCSENGTSLSPSSGTSEQDLPLYSANETYQERRQDLVASVDQTPHVASVNGSKSTPEDNRILPEEIIHQLTDNKSTRTIDTAGSKKSKFTRMSHESPVVDDELENALKTTNGVPPSPIKKSHESEESTRQMERNIAQQGRQIGGIASSAQENARSHTSPPPHDDWCSDSDVDNPAQPPSRRPAAFPALHDSLMENISTQLSMLQDISQVYPTPHTKQPTINNFLLTPQHILQGTSLSQQQNLQQRQQQHDTLHNMIQEMNTMYLSHLHRLEEENERLRKDLEQSRKEKDEIKRDKKQMQKLYERQIQLLEADNKRLRQSTSTQAPASTKTR